MRRSGNLMWLISGQNWSLPFNKRERERERERKRWWQTIKSMHSLNLLPSQQKFWGKRNKKKYIDIKKKKHECIHT